MAEKYVPTKMDTMFRSKEAQETIAEAKNEEFVQLETARSAAPGNLKHAVLPKGTSAEDQANFFTLWFMSYLNPVLTIGSKHTLLHEELGPISKRDSCEDVEKRFEHFWEIERAKPLKEQSLWLVLWRMVGWFGVWQFFLLYLIYGGITFGPVLILNALVQYIQGTGPDLSTGLLWFLVAMIFALPMTGAFFSTRSNVIVAHMSIQIRNALINKIYRKAMLLSPAARQETSTGQIVTMFSNDSKQIQTFLLFMNNAIIAPFQIIVALALIYQQVGVTMFIGLGFLLVMIPLNGFIFVELNAVRRRKVQSTDVRVKIMNEILSGIRVIKYYAWESAFNKKIGGVRLRELELLKQLAYIQAIAFTLVLQAVPIIQPILVFFAYVRLGNTLSAARSFTTIALFNIMQLPFAFLPLGIAQYSQSLVSTRRMLDFFNAEELTEYVQSNITEDGTAISMENVSLCWTLPVVEVDLTLLTDKEQKTLKKDQIKEDKINKVAEQEKIYMGEKEVVINSNKDDDDLKMQQSIKEEEVGINRSEHTLMGVDFNVKKGQLIAVVGAVGCGKSSLLSGLLGEMQLQEGSVRMAGSVAYCDQRPWILNTTVKDNILFGKPFNEALFDRAIHASSLEDDIKVLPGGVLTEIGERGINLSGGQKARVALARAIYRDADVYLLDDPLSAVDAHVGQHIFHECIMGALKDKTRVLVTHQVHLLHLCDLVLIMDEGKVKAFGSYEELTFSGIDISAFIPKSGDELDDFENDPTAVTGSHGPPKTTTPTFMKDIIPQPSKDMIIGRPSNMSKHGSVLDVPPKQSISQSMYQPRVEEKEEESTTEVIDAVPTNSWQGEEGENTDVKDILDILNGEEHKESVSSKMGDYNTSKDKDATARKADKREGTKLVTLEEKFEGDVQYSTYKYYIKAGGYFKFLGVVFFMCLSQALSVVANYWLAFWGTVSTRELVNGQPLTVERNTYFLNFYALFTVMGVVALTVRAVVLAEHRMGTSVLMHEELVKSVLGAPVAFFDVTPQGRILNRFSSDMVIIDEELSASISQLFNSVFQVLGAIGAIAAATQGIFLILMVPLIFLYETIQRYFRKANTAVARLQSVSLSPIYADFSQALTGLSTIRAYGVKSDFVNDLRDRVDYNTTSAIMSQLLVNWLAIRLDFIGSIISFFIAVLAIAARGFIPASFLALGLTYSFQLTAYLKYAVRMIATAEAQMNNVERICYYIDNIEQEDDHTKMGPDGTEVIPPDNWPEEGNIQVQNLQMRYRDGPLVLKGVDFSIKGGEKIGIAGRTGSGKSSMMIALFRISELADGKVLIDGIDTSTVPLNILRSKIGIIPQDPVIFSASVRFNLDPFEAHTDREVWGVLESVDMKDHVLSLPGKLSEEVAEGGDNFSTGQRQLICIARALLRSPKILVLDEATASIDNETDDMIQKMVRVNFKDCTVLTIAHRLNTIVDSDRIIVLDNGLLAEIDMPDVLMNTENGAFKALWDRHQESHIGTISRGSSLNSLNNLDHIVEEDTERERKL
mmetsp:Transcript_13658/g.13206  ORF Transcript_13658/g.13206 Transcript_13658/m.13206 type:complete len:1517 (+) Transcript_13658:272-4822(+)